jgi:FkbM family methyltransferase
MNYRSFKSFVPTWIQNICKSNLLLTLALFRLPFPGFLNYVLKRHARKGKLKSSFDIDVGSGATVRLRSNSTDIQIFEQIFLLRDCEASLKSAPNLIIDGGAHVGCSAIYYGLQYPGAKIIAVEAEKSNYEMLKNNVKQFPNIDAIHAAIWFESGEVEISNPDDDGWSFRVHSPLNRAHPNAISAVTLDELLDTSGFTQIDLLKLDIEGAEKQVFSSPDLKWLNATRNMVIEIHDNIVPGCSDTLKSALKSYSFKKIETTFNLIYIDIKSDPT